MPPTVVWDVTETWILGEVLCKIILFLQNIAVVTSLLVLAFIAYHRSETLKFPFAPTFTTAGVTSRSKARVIIILIWIISMILASPEP